MELIKKDYETQELWLINLSDEDAKILRAVEYELVYDFYDTSLYNTIEVWMPRNSARWQDVLCRNQ